MTTVWFSALLGASFAAAAPQQTFRGFYGEVVSFPSGYAVESEMRGDIEVVRFFPEGTKVGPAEFSDENQYAAKDLLQLLVIPKATSKVRSVEEVRKSKVAEFQQAGAKVRIRPAKAFVEGSFFVRVLEPYRQTQAYVEGSHYFFSVLSGHIGPLFRSVVNGLVATSVKLGPPAEPEPAVAPGNPVETEAETARRRLITHRFRLTPVAAEELGLPMETDIETYLGAFAAYLEKEYAVPSERSWQVAAKGEGKYDMRFRIRMLQKKLFKKKVDFRWRVDLVTGKVEGVNERSAVFFYPEAQIN